MKSTLNTKPERDIRPKFQKLRIYLREKTDKSGFLQLLFAFFYEAMARISIFTGSRYNAFEYLLRAQRNVSHTVFGERRAYLLNELMDHFFYKNGKLSTLSDNRYLSKFIESDEACEIRSAYNNFPSDDILRMRIPKNNDDPERQGNLILLKKWSPVRNDKGVILLKYNTAIESFPALFNIAEVVKQYQIVLEPSFKGYQHPRFFLYLGYDAEVVVMAQYLPDYNYIRSLGSNLIPIRLGAADWVEPEIFGKVSSEQRDFDIAMVAAWSPLKRHELLFKAINNINIKNKRSIRLALIGYPWEWEVGKIGDLLNKYELSESTRIYQSVSHEKVAEILRNSKISVFLSPMEGASKALYESLFCGAVPIIHKHNQGIDLDKITSDVGILADEYDLPERIIYALDNFSKFKPFEWAMNNTGCYRSTEILEDVLKKISDTDNFGKLTVKKNAPHLRYAESSKYQDFENEYKRLDTYLINS